MFVKHYKYCLTIFILLWLISVSYAEVDLKTEIPLFLKIITYDDNFKPEELEVINIYIVYEQKFAASYKQYLIVKEYFTKKSKLTIKDIPIRFYGIGINNLDSVFSEINKTSYNVLFTTKLSDDLLKKLIKKKNEYKLRTFSFNPEHIKLGLAVSIRPNKKKNPIIINLKQAQLEGSNFSAHLLKMCEIYKKQ